jgi:hypothetical protein
MLALGDSGNEIMFADRQAAAIFELRDYKEYREITSRILSRLREKCLVAPNKDSPPVRTVADEISLTLSSLEKR